MKCPHSHIQFCPLYVESHNCRGMGCVDLLHKPCKVERKEIKYDKAVDTLDKIDPILISECFFGEKEFERVQQRKRNMKALGIREEN